MIICGFFRTLLLASALIVLGQAAEDETKNNLPDPIEVGDDDRLFTEFFGLQTAPDLNSSLLLRSLGGAKLPASIEITSPYQAIPGTYHLKDNRVFNGKSTYNAKQIYEAYLATGTFLFHNPGCMLHYSTVPKVTEEDISKAFTYAFQQLPIRYPEYINIDSYQGKERKEIEGYYLLLVAEYFAKL